MASLFSNYLLVRDSGLFDETYYCNAYPEIRERNLDPLLHYLETGAMELRNPSATFDARKYVRLCQERGEHVENPLLHCIGTRAALGSSPSLPEVVTPEGADLLVALDWVRVELGLGAERIRGSKWCLAPSPIVELAVQLGSTSTRACYGLPRTHVARKFPQYLKADHSGFEFSLSPFPAGQAGIIELVFIARTAAGANPRKRSIPIDLAIVRTVHSTGGAAGVATEELFESFIDERLWRYYFGTGSNEIDLNLYLQIPLRARPVLSCFFDPQYYLATNPDVSAAGMDPFIHFLQSGCSESRSPHPLIDFVIRRPRYCFIFSRGPSVLELHEALVLDLVDPSPYFSLDYYKNLVPRSEILQCGLLGHFLTQGLVAGLRPNPLF